MITDSYVDLTYKGTAPATNIVVNGYSIKAKWPGTGVTLINYLSTSSNWSEYAVAGKTTAVGAATLEEFCSSYKLTHPEKYLECITTTAGDTTYITAGAKAVGYVLRFNEAGVTDVWEYNKDIGTTDTFYIKTGTSYGSNTIKAYWLASRSANYVDNVIDVQYFGSVNDNDCSYALGGVRPLVSLTSAVLVENASGEIEVKE